MKLRVFGVLGVVLPLALLFIEHHFVARRIGERRFVGQAVRIGRVAGATEIVFAPSGSYCAIRHNQQATLARWNGHGLQLSNSDLPDPERLNFSSEGREVAFLRTTQTETDSDDLGISWSHEVPSLWKMTIFDTATGTRKRVVTLVQPKWKQTEKVIWENAVDGVYFDGPGNEFRVWDAQGNIEVLDAQSGKERARLSSQAFPCVPQTIPNGAKFMLSPDGRTVFSSTGRTIALTPSFVDAQSGRDLWKWPEVQNVSFSPNGQLVLGKVGNQLVARETRTGVARWLCSLPPLRNWTLAPDENSLVEIRADGSMWNWPLQ